MDSRCTTYDAKRYVEILIGDAEARAPVGGGRLGKPYTHHFLSMSAFDALSEYEQVKQLPLQDRERDLVERMGLDGRAAG